jgi:hypothetical protein
MDSETFRRLQRDAEQAVTKLLAAAYEAGRRDGADATRQRMIAVLAEDEASGGKRSKTRRAALEPSDRATVSRPLREAIRMGIPVPPAGWRSHEFAEYMQTHVDPALTERRIRAALKALEKSGDVERVERGRYRPRLAAGSGHEPEAPTEGKSAGAPSGNGAMPLNL